MMDEIFEHQRKDREWRQTELGKAFYRYENLTASAWVADSNEDTAEGRLKKIWAEQKEARDVFMLLLRGFA